MKVFRNKNKIILLILAGLLVAAMIAGAIALFGGGGEKGDATVANDSRVTLLDYEGHSVKLSEFKRRAVIAHSWASWCTYCADELRHLSEIKKIFGDEIDVLAINRAEPQSVAKEFTESLGLASSGIKFLLDPEDVFYTQIEGYAMPETIITDTDGNTLYHEHGPLTFKDMVSRLGKILLR